MALKCGIVGLPNVGKSTIFSALTKNDVGVANYPFCTIDPNTGTVEVPDKRLTKLAQIMESKKIVPTTTQFVDIAGLVKGASQGEGLGNQFLGHIKQVDAILHVVRCFEDKDIVHVQGRVHPVEDIEIIATELALADLETVEKRLSQLQKIFKRESKLITKDDRSQFTITDKIKRLLEQGDTHLMAHLTAEEMAQVQDLHLMCLKKQLIVCNVDDVSDDNNPYVKEVAAYCQKNQLEYLVISGKLEKELSELSNEEKDEFMADLGITESGFDRLIAKAYTLLNLQTFFTSGETETRAWTIGKDTLAPQAGGVIHTDFEKGFIKAEIYHCDDLFQYGQVSKLREAGKVRLEGKNYIVKDGDVITFRFN